VQAAAEGVYQFRIPMPPNQIRPSSRERYTLVYALETSDGWVMVDAGMDSEQGLEALRRQIPEAGLDPRDFSLIVVTHGHNDHFGLAAKAREFTGAPVAIHRADATNPYVLTFDADAGPPEVDVLLEGGEELVPGSGLWTIWTPGHTPGHTCVHDRGRRLLFSGDHVLPVTTPNVSRYPTDSGNPLQDFIDAHRALAELDVRMVHPAHEHSFENLRARVDEIIEHHHERNEEILAAAADGPRSAAGIAARISWNVGTWDEMNADTRNMAIWETNAHLHYLVREGRLIEEQRGARAITEAFRAAFEGEPLAPIALVGCGRLGRPTLASEQLAQAGYEIAAAFDADPRQIGHTIRGLTVESVDGLEDALAASGIAAAIIAVPPRYAQGVADRLAAAGVRTIIDYTGTVEVTAERVRVVHVEAIRAFQSSAYALAPQAASP